MFHSTITLIENFAHSVSLTFLPAMFAPVKAAGARREINLRLERGKRVRDLRRDNKRNARVACFLKTHMFLEIAQEKKEGTGEEKHMRESG